MLSSAMHRMYFASSSYNTGRRDVLDLLTEPEGMVNKSNTFRLLVY